MACVGILPENHHSSCYSLNEVLYTSILMDLLDNKCCKALLILNLNISQGPFKTVEFFICSMNALNVENKECKLSLSLVS